MEPYPKLLLSAKDRGVKKKAQLRSSENVQSIKTTATDVVSLLHDDESSHGTVMDFFFLAGAKNPVSTLMYPRQRCALNSEVMSLQLSLLILTGGGICGLVQIFRFHH